MVLEDNGEDNIVSVIIKFMNSQERTFLNNTLHTKVNWIGHILRRNCLLHDSIKGHMTKVKGVGKRRTQLLDDLRNRRRYWELKEEAEDRKRRRRQFINRT